MPERAHHDRRRAVAPKVTSRHRPQERSLFSGIYGLVLASALAAALDTTGEKADPGPDALWILLTALTSAAAHGYAHVIAQRATTEETADGTANGATGATRLRLVLAEWPLVAATLPTVAILLTAQAGWWAETTAVDTALLFNTLALFTWGTQAARTAGHRWPSAYRAGALDMLLGLVIIIANALIK
ncbi:hypothetical protein ACFUN8_20010 [Streptomyces sp. NPDC057307]|uniref:hypothetical protein n=1 Tax=Streptomyces sp. NPDC057307 TaxID=3346096 RepID=UPI003633E67B